MSHNRSLLSVLFIIIALLSVSISVASAATDSTIVLQLSSGANASALASTYGLTIVDQVEPLRVVVLKGSSSATTAASADSRVLYASAEKKLQGQPKYFGFTSTDQLMAQPKYFGFTGVPSADYSQQWGVKQVRNDLAHTISTGAGTIVAVLDTGVDVTHPQLVGKFVDGYDFVDEDNNPQDITNGLDDDGDNIIDEAAGHGTHVAGIVNLVAPNAKIMPIRIFDTDGVANYTDVMEGIIYAADHGATVVNISGNSSDASPLLQQGVDYATSRGVVVVVAVGIREVGYPAAYPNVISVGANDQNDYMSAFAPASADIYAPGEAIYSTYLSGIYATWTGHSMATPFVAGAVALMRSAANCDATCATNGVINSARRLNTNGDHLRLDAYDAAALAANQTNFNIEVQSQRYLYDAANDAEIVSQIKLINHGNSVNLSDITVRYWYNQAATGSQVTVCDYTTFGCANVQGRVVAATKGNSTHYIETSFAAAAGKLWGEDSSNEIQLRTYHTNWSLYNETDDYSYVATTTPTTNTKITVYYRGQLVSGVEP